MEKVEYFLYDILGLCIPGFVVILTLDFIFDFIGTILELLINIPEYCFAFLFGSILLITCYIIGSLLKVISKNIYNFLRFLSKDCPLCKNIFLPQEYDNQFEPYYKKIIERLEIKKELPKNDDNQNIFYNDIYKLAQIVTMSDSIKTHSNMFLAKYYLYKLLACWSFLYIFIVIIYNYNFSHPILLIIGLIIIFFSFNEKYKLYKKLNGNELIMALYYYLYKTTL
ncbi:hypothetical protein IJ541_00725 [bacterium]|nr:hypothetical protein [bacterium]